MFGGGSVAEQDDRAGRREDGALLQERGACGVVGGGGGGFVDVGVVVVDVVLEDCFEGPAVGDGTDGAEAGQRRGDAGRQPELGTRGGRVDSCFLNAVVGSAFCFG